PIVDPMAPKLSESVSVELPSKNTGDKSNEEPIFFEISSSADQRPVMEFDLNPEEIKPEHHFKKPDHSIDKNPPQPIVSKEASNTSALSSGSLPVKPAQIYAEEQRPVNAKSNVPEEPLPLQINLPEDEPIVEMKLVVKETHAAEEKPAE